MMWLLAQTVPAVPVEAFASGLLSELGDAIAFVLPYAAAVTAFVIGVAMLRRWLGHRNAASMGDPFYDIDNGRFRPFGRRRR